MAAAYLVKYTSPKGEPCPDAVVIFDSMSGEDVGELAPQIKAVLQLARGSYWKCKISSIEYIGPWFDGRTEIAKTLERNA